MKATIERKMRQEIALGKPLVRREIVARGLRGNTLSEMAAEGVLRRVARGVYAPCEGVSSASFDYELAALVAPKGVFTLLSALRIHQLTDENPKRMTIAIPLKSHPPKTTLPIDFVYMTPDLLARDVIEQNVGTVSFRVFSVERTIAECFKMRNKIGIAVAVSALQAAERSQMINFAALGRILSQCRMSRIARPYLEALT